MSSLFNSTQQRSSLEGAISQLEAQYLDSATLFLTTTPLITNDVEQATSISLTANNVVSISWQPRAWLPITGTGGLNTVQRTDKTYIPFGIQDGRSRKCGGDTTGSFGLGHARTSRDATLNVGTAMPTLGQRLTIALGGNFHSGATADFSAYTNQLFPGVSQPSVFPASIQTSADASTYGWYFEPRLNFNSAVLRRARIPVGRRERQGTHAAYNGTGVTTGGVGGLRCFPQDRLFFVDRGRPTE